MNLMLNSPKMVITQDGLDKLKKEYEELTGVKRTLTVDRVARARDQGDLSENSEYHAAREELDLIEARIAELKNILDHAEIVTHQNTTNMVSLGSTVVVDMNGIVQEFTLVGSLESNPMQKKISNESPVGQALIGKKVGDIVSLPATEIQYKILEIK